MRRRLVPIENANTKGIRGLCLSPVDLAVSKLAAGREKDLEFVTLMLSNGIVSAEAVESVLNELGEDHRSLIRARLVRCNKAG